MTRAGPQVVIGSGHLTDSPDRPKPRFPQDRVPWVTQQVRQTLDAWGVGPGTTVVSGGARGADIVVAEAGLARGAHVVICLALPPCEFEQHSVSLPGSDWSARFRRLLGLVEVRQLSHEVDNVPEGDAVFARANAWIVDIARQWSRTPYAVIVWDGGAGEGPGGTSDLVARLGYPENDPRLHVIDPTPRT